MGRVKGFSCDCRYILLSDFLVELVLEFIIPLSATVGLELIHDRCHFSLPLIQRHDSTPRRNSYIEMKFKRRREYFSDAMTLYLKKVISVRTSTINGT